MEEQTKLLVHDPNTIFYVILDVIRMIILLIFTHSYLTSPYQTILKPFYLITFWKTIIAARISETWIIKFINGLVEFDEKVMPLLSHLSAQQHSISKFHWNTFFILLIMYCLGFKLTCFYFFPPRTLDVQFFADFCLGPPFVIHFVVFYSTCFFLYNLYIRFETLNDLWKSLPIGSNAVPDQWTHLEVVILVDDIRLLHAELSELLKIFSRGYGPLLIIFFASSYINTLLNVYFSYSLSAFLPYYSFTQNILRVLIFCMGIGQSIICVLVIMILASSINDQRKKIIRYARLNRISMLPADIKRQIKMFMNQVSVYESDEITAFGLFKINLNLVMSILTLIITGIATSIQIKENPIILNFINDVVAISTRRYKNVKIDSSTDSYIQ